MRVAIIGARRVRGGTGPFLARFCAEAGSEVCAVLGTTKESAASAAQALRTELGQETRGYARMEDLLEQAAPEALVIASPARTHRPHLVAALEAGLHVLCEKPLVWGGDDPAREAAALAASFVGHGLWLRVQAQWPQTLPTYRSLYPEAPLTPTHFEMLMAPSCDGLRMLVESLSHPLSLLAALAPDLSARLEGLSVQRTDDDWHVSFRYCAGSRVISATVHVERCVHQPRPAWYALDGLRAERRVLRLDPYLLELAGAGRAVEMPDPTRLLVRSFLHDVAAGTPPVVDPAAVPGVEHLAEIVEAARMCGTSD